MPKNEMHVFFATVKTLDGDVYSESKADIESISYSSGDLSIHVDVEFKDGRRLQIPWETVAEITRTRDSAYYRP